MNILQNVTNSLGDSMSGVVIGIIDFLPNLILCIILTVLGFLFGGILGRAVAHLGSVLRIDSILEKAGIKIPNVSISKVFGMIVRWAVIIGFLMTATEVVGLSQFTNFLQLILAYIPNVIAAALIFIATFLLADFVSKLISHSAHAAGIKGTAAGAIARYAVIIVGVLASLAQLKIATGFMEILFTGMVGAISIALGLAFGLGGKDAAARAIDRVENNFK